MFDGNPHELPALAAVFLIEFDHRAGYTIKWKRSIPSVILDGVVEYKSLPSGLHNIKEDLVYFIHDDYAGLSAFLNEPAAESERNAHMIAVGVLVPLSYGRLGKSWRHAQGLKDLARELAGDLAATQLLDDYWELHRLRDGEGPEVIESPFASPSVPKFKDVKGGRPNGALTRNRAMSDATPLLSSPQTLSPYHPALSLPEFITTFGPLVFPLYRAALLRKRILIVGEAPVQETCNFVYVLSILSNVPLSIHSLLPADLPPLRLRPLFNVGIHDIPYLEQLAKPDASSQSSTGGFDSSWVACTTDQVLATKAHLYDILVTLPPPYSKNATSKVYPKLSTPHTPPSQTKAAKKPSRSPYPAQHPIKATQRDARRYITLRRGLRHLPRCDTAAPSFLKLVSPNSTLSSNRTSSAVGDSSDTISTTSSTTPSILEPLSWPLFAYNSFIWWASAGESRTDLEEESTHDTDLLFTDIDNLATTQPSTSIGNANSSDLEVNQQPGRRPRRKSISSVGFGKGVPVREMALVAYFHRLTTLIFSTLSDVIARQDAEENESEEPDTDALGGDEAEDAQNLGAAAASSHTNTNGNRKPQTQPSRTSILPGDPASESAPLLNNGKHLPKTQHPRTDYFDAEDDDEDTQISISAEDVLAMGLDVWSEADRCFVEDVAGCWFGRRARVKGGRVECCGVRLY